MIHWILLQPKNPDLSLVIFTLSCHFHSPFLCNLAVYLHRSRFMITSSSCSTCQIKAEMLLTFTIQSIGIWLTAVTKEETGVLNFYPIFASLYRHFLLFQSEAAPAAATGLLNDSSNILNLVAECYVFRGAFRKSWIRGGG